MRVSTFPSHWPHLSQLVNSRHSVADPVPLYLSKDHANERFGGRGEEKCFNDTWVFHAIHSTWEELAVTGDVPVRRHGHAACIIDPYLYVFGGQTWAGRLLDDMYAFNMESACSLLLI
jgi:hypothetical protein